MVDLTKYSVPLLYSRSKNLDYKKSIIETSTSLLLFLKQQGMIADDPLDEYGALKLDFIVKESDLTSEGIELFKKAIPAWLRKLDRGGKPDDTSSLLVALEEIIKSRK
ncbi:hypothetical protein [Cohnella sp.]|uniref:hypothetical protein n=1 Tax=Cohnella sp. TaxID=1883426 RepID=UPI003568267B